ncbi:MAG: DUF3501 family protein [Pseudomonadota bacterium]
MQKLTRADLYSLEHYAELRPGFRSRVMAHKKNRQLAIGPHVTLYFEDRLTIHYQIQEMLRAERIFEADGIEAELEAYNPLIPDGGNWKATMMIEYADIAERQQALGRMMGIEDRVWIGVNGFERVFAIADEDLERETRSKTSAVHFLRFELTPGMAVAVKSGAEITAGIDHQAYIHEVDSMPDPVRVSLAADLD